MGTEERMKNKHRLSLTPLVSEVWSVGYIWVQPSHQFKDTLWHYLSKHVHNSFINMVSTDRNHLFTNVWRMPPCSTHIQHWPKFSISFFLIPEFLLCTSCPCRTLLPDTSYTWQTKTKDEFLTATIPFRFLVSLNWKPHVNTCTYVRDNGTAIILPSCL